MISTAVVVERLKEEDDEADFEEEGVHSSMVTHLGGIRGEILRKERSTFATEPEAETEKVEEEDVDYLKWVSETKRSTGNLNVERKTSSSSSTSSSGGEKCSSSLSQESGFVASSTESPNNSDTNNRHGSPDSGYDHHTSNSKNSFINTSKNVFLSLSQQPI